MTANVELLADLPPLGKGKHSRPAVGACLLEAVSYVAGEPWSDHPACVSPVLAAFGRALNDALPDNRRQELAPLIPQLIGTVDPEADQRDGLVCAHWYVSHWCPAWLDLVPALAEHAAAMRALPAPASWDDIAEWQPVLAAAAAARDAPSGADAWDGAWAAAWAAAGSALQPTVAQLQGDTIALYTELVTTRSA